MKAIVTGGSRGIGRSISNVLLREGCEVMITGTNINQGNSSEFKYFKVDFKDKDSTAEFLQEAKSFQPEILVNNAGINVIDNFEDIKEHDFDDIIKVNLKAPFLTCQAVIPSMKEKNYGRIVNIGSIFSILSKAKRASYSASKFGLDGLTKALASEVSEFNILANCVSPGVIETDLTRKILGEAGISQMKKNIPQGRLGGTEEVAELVFWLASKNNSYISGQNILIDGGYSVV
tara:strand:+ start:8563 stop:9261 length:699 start_codon:yes stop_codon:yes gene_type:complete